MLAGKDSETPSFISNGCEMVHFYRRPTAVASAAPSVRPSHARSRNHQPARAGKAYEFRSGACRTAILRRVEMRANWRSCVAWRHLTAAAAVAVRPVNHRHRPTERTNQRPASVGRCFGPNWTRASQSIPSRPAQLLPGQSTHVATSEAIG